MNTFEGINMLGDVRETGDGSAIGVFRNSTRTVRLLAGIVIVTFGGLVTSPAVAAMRGQSPVSRLPKQSIEQRLAVHLRAVKSDVDSITRQLHSKRTMAAEDARVKDLKSKLKGLNTAVMASFNAVDSMIARRHLPKVIQQRQNAMVAHYKKSFDATIAGLSAVLAAKPGADRLAKIKAVRKSLGDMKFGRSHQPYNPRDLNPLFKSNLGNKPKLTRKEFLQAASSRKSALSIRSAAQYSATAPATASTSGASDPSYLAATPEVTLTQAIKDKAAALGHNPVKIYNWVRNNIVWLPTWGAFQSADMTLSTQHGNSIDIASLTIALLRASGIPSRYVYGTIEVPADQFTNWVGDFDSVTAAQNFASAGGIATAAVYSGGKVTKMRMSHVWVEAWINYMPSRGAKAGPGNAWVSIDPSFKQYSYNQGLDAGAISGIDPNNLINSFLQGGTVNNAEGWVQGLGPTVFQNAQQQTQQNLDNYISSNLNSPTIGDVVGDHRVIIEDHSGIPASLPNHVVVVGARYADLPDDLRDFMSFAFGKDALGEPQNPIRLPWAVVNNERITLSFQPATDADEQALDALLPPGGATDISQLPSSIPAYLVHVVPTLKLDGHVIKTGSPMSLGSEMDFVFQVKTPLETRAPYTYKVIAGSYLDIASIGQNVAASRLFAVKSRLQATQAILLGQDQTQLDTLTKEDVLGDLFDAGMLSYFAEFDFIGHKLALQQHAGYSLAIGYGSYGYEPHVTYLFGIPTAITPGGVVMNIRYADFITTHEDDHTANVQFREELGLLSSALEASVPEQMFSTSTAPVKAASTVNALVQAMQAGQRIYFITPDNEGTTLPNIHHGSLVMGEIRDALAVGDDVITHTDDISVPGWTGSGYILLDPETGVSAYKIGGGFNGGVMKPALENNKLISAHSIYKLAEIAKLYAEGDKIDAYAKLTELFTDKVGEAVDHQYDDIRKGAIASTDCLFDSQKDAILEGMDALGSLGNIGVVGDVAQPELLLGQALGYTYIALLAINLIKINAAIGDCTPK